MKEELFTTSSNEVVETYRTVVYECHVHHRLEYTVLDFILFVQILDLAEKSTVELLAFFWAGRFMKVWFVAFLCRCKECELRDSVGSVQMKAWAPASPNSPHRISPPMS